MSPSATFVKKGSVGWSAFYTSDKTARTIGIIGRISGHHYLYFGTNYGLSSRTNLWLYHGRVLGRYEDEHLQMSGLIIKQQLTKDLAMGILNQWGNQRGEGVFLAMKLPLIASKGSECEGDGDEQSPRLNLHMGITWSRWRSEWEGEEWTPYIGLTYHPKARFSVIAEIQERKRDFFKPSWVIAIHYQLSRQWGFSVGLNQSGLSDRPYPFLGLSIGDIR
ncbi:MAG: hypothetical protein RMK18_11925 [Armatimonadota bacterium]|nr:hypothetical protein [Armatimonadota bacterium]MDW8026555.1 hypothetical protein [Armatimonadota bacterium]